MDEKESALVDRLVHYFYHFYYDDMSEAQLSMSPEITPLALDTNIYTMGDEYNMSDIKRLAKAKFSRALPTGWNKEEFPKVIRTIYDTTPASDCGLRDCLVLVLQAYKLELRVSREFMDLMRSHGEFAVDLVDAWANLSQLAPRLVADRDR
ncbi:MAG: hypothetical protein Q9201_000733 [Fulgogasparrea decipioides]